jgi:RNA:NAD 2'-phosphotransferase (TPT1/KptA family)
MAPSANAVSLVLVVLMPSDRQAISSSRNASQARQTGSRRSRSVIAAVSSASAKIR